MKTLKFDSSLVTLILSGEKTATWRLFDDKKLGLGDELEFIERQSNNLFSRATIISVTEKTWGEIDEADFEGHEKFTNYEEMIETYQKYYNGKVDKNTLVKVIRFKIK